MNWRYFFKLATGSLATLATAAYAPWLQAGHELGGVPPLGYWILGLAAMCWWGYGFVDATPQTPDAASTDSPSTREAWERGSGGEGSVAVPATPEPTP